MIIKKLNNTHEEALKPIFDVTKYMGANIEDTDFFAKTNMARIYHKGFCTTYLSDLTSYHAFGAFDEDDNIIGAISCYQSTEEPAWYGTQIRSMRNKNIARALLDHMIKFNEEAGRFKFYTLWNAKHAKLLRRFNFSDWANERYDYFDECLVPAKTRCLYTHHWQILFNRILLPNDTIVRCTFLKQQYREPLPIGGNI
jgi:hypothetical protein